MWNQILEWFGDRRERQIVLKDFNKAAKAAYVSGLYPILLEAKVTIGNTSYRHNFSKFMAGGFRIKALSGTTLQISDLNEIGKVILSDEVLVRKLISLGWDTLEVHDLKGSQGSKWQLTKFARVGGFLK